MDDNKAEFIHTAVLIACNESLMATRKVSIKMRVKQQQQL